MIDKLNVFVQTIVHRLDPFIKLFLRLVIAAVFVPAGWGKLHNMHKTIEFFQSLNIPLAQIQAPMIATLEFSMGLCVFVGFFSRLATLPLMGIMTVALLTADRDDIKNISTLLDQTPFLYLTILLAILLLGSGAFSLDRFTKRD